MVWPVFDEYTGPSEYEVELFTCRQAAEDRRRAILEEDPILNGVDIFEKILN